MNKRVKRIRSRGTHVAVASEKALQMKKQSVVSRRNEQTHEKIGEKKVT
jgi:hypothetical protein